jgi:NADPH:quinone reductase-like Zn-dependent oxidoreductase
MTGGVGGLQGSLAKFAAVDAHLLARKPANLSMLFEAGKIMPRLDHRHFTLETVCDAYRAIKSGPVAGKIVVDVDVLGLAGE